MLPAEFLKEAETMSKLRHQNIVCIIGVSVRQEPFWIVTELLGKGDLLNYLKKMSNDDKTMPFQGSCAFCVLWFVKFVFGLG